MLQLFSLKASDLVKSNGLNFLLIPNWPLGDLWYSLLPFRNVFLASLFLSVRRWALQCLESFAWPSLIAQLAPLLWPHPLTHAWLHTPLFSPKLQSHFQLSDGYHHLDAPFSNVQTKPNASFLLSHPVVRGLKNLQTFSVLPFLSQLLYVAPVTESHKFYPPKSYSTLFLLFHISILSIQALHLTHLDCCCTGLLTSLFSLVYSLPVQFLHCSKAFY